MSREQCKKNYSRNLQSYNNNWKINSRSLSLSLNLNLKYLRKLYHKTISVVNIMRN